MLKINESSYRGIAQLVEQRSPKPRAEGSSPSAPAKTKIRSRKRADFRFVFFTFHFSFFTIHYSLNRIFVMNNEVATLMNNESLIYIRFLLE